MLLVHGIQFTHLHDFECQLDKIWLIVYFEIIMFHFLICGFLVKGETRVHVESSLIILHLAYVIAENSIF